METKDSEAYKAGDWIIKSQTSNGNIKEATFSGQEEARHTIKVLREFGMEGHFEFSPGHASLPAEYGPYTRIEKENE